MRCGVPNRETDLAEVVRLTPNKYLTNLEWKLNVVFLLFGSLFGN